MNKVRLIIWSLIVGCSAFIYGCAHDGLAGRCAKTDWYHRAFDQAALGLPLRDGGELLRNCEGRGDSDKFYAESARGLLEGKAKYCSPENALILKARKEKKDQTFCK